MIAVIASILGGLMMGIKVPLLSPLVYLLKYRRDIFLISFCVHSILLSYEITVTDIYKINPLIIFAVLIPAILLLDAGLKESERKIELGKIIKSPFNYITGLMVVGILVKEIFILSVLILLLYSFSSEKPRKGIFPIALFLLLVISVLLFFQKFIDFYGSAASQVILISALSTLFGVIFWKEVRKTELFVN